MFPSRTLLLWGGLCLAAPLAAQSTQTLQFLPIADRAVTSAPFQVVALSSAYLPMSLSVTGPANLNGRVLTLTGVGTVTVTAKQTGNSQYAPASASISFRSLPEVPQLTVKTSASLIYGAPFKAASLGITAAASPMPAYANDTAQVSSSKASTLAPGAALSYLANDPAIRYEGGTISPTADPNARGGYDLHNYPAPYSGYLRMAFTCDCSAFEVKIEGRTFPYRIWVDGNWTTPDNIQDPTPYPTPAYILVKFPDRRPRQIKFGIGGNAPIFGVNTPAGESISAPQVPIGPRVLFLGDSWTGPTILPPAIGPAQIGLAGGGYPQALGEYFNWDYWYDGTGGSGFTVTGPYTGARVFPARAQTDICSNPIDAAFLFGSVNDGSSSFGAIQGAVEDTLSTIQGCKPSDPIYFYGVQQDQPQNEQAQAAAVAAEPKNVTYYNDGKDNWFYGSSTDASTGNNYAYLNGHPTPLGHDFLAQEIAAHLTAQLPALTPKPYPLFTQVPLAGSMQASVADGAILGAGQHTMTATFTPADATHYAAASLQSTVIVAKATTAVATQLMVLGSTAVEIFTVAPQFQGTPTGTLQILVNGSSLGSAPLAGGRLVLPFPASMLPGFRQPGTKLTAVYSGDANFLPVSSSFTLGN